MLIYTNFMNVIFFNYTINSYEMGYFIIVIDFTFHFIITDFQSVLIKVEEHKQYRTQLLLLFFVMIDFNQFVNRHVTNRMMLDLDT